MNPALVLAAAIGGLLLLRRERPDRRDNAVIKPARRRRNPVLSDSERRQLEEARRISAEFHGTPDHVLEIPENRRLLPRFVAEVGKLEEFSYNPPADSQRDDHNSIYSHEVGDRGILAPKAKSKPRLAVDPRTRRPIILPDRSPMRFDEERGFVG